MKNNLKLNNNLTQTTISKCMYKQNNTVRYIAITASMILTTVASQFTLIQIFVVFCAVTKASQRDQRIQDLWQVVWTCPQLAVAVVAV